MGQYLKFGAAAALMWTLFCPLVSRRSATSVHYQCVETEPGLASIAVIALFSPSGLLQEDVSVLPQSLRSSRCPQKFQVHAADSRQHAGPSSSGSLLSGFFLQPSLWSSFVKPLLGLLGRAARGPFPHCLLVVTVRAHSSFS